MAIFRSTPDSFRVEEVPAYDPSGEGTHVFVFIEKRGLTTPEAIRVLAQALAVDPRDVGYGGMKDKNATTSQWLSFPESASAKLTDLQIPDVRILKQVRHGNKLRIGHVRKNIFEVVLTEVLDSQHGSLTEGFHQIVSDGVPNRYGQQRFGYGDNVSEGLAILAGKRRMNDRRKRTLLISSVQSAVFNQVLAWRVEQGNVLQVLEGDVLQKAATGGMFTSTDHVLDQARLREGELVTTGPLPGAKSPRPLEGSIAAALELRAMNEIGLTEELVEKNARDLPGARRPLIMKVEATQPPRSAGDTLTLSFALPSGAYATVVVDALLASVANSGEAI
jgi:tRNA pseudouridine13 synthase